MDQEMMGGSDISWTI